MRRAQMVGMGMGIDDQPHLQPLRLDMGQQGLGIPGAGRRRDGIEIQYRIDDQRRPRPGVRDDILPGAGGLVVKRRDIGA